VRTSTETYGVPQKGSSRYRHQDRRFVGTADVFPHLVELHQKLRAVFLEEIARKNN
jgi:hypothetical protein